MKLAATLLATLVFAQTSSQECDSLTEGARPHYNVQHGVCEVLLLGCPPEKVLDSNINRCIPSPAYLAFTENQQREQDAEALASMETFRESELLQFQEVIIGVLIGCLLVANMIMVPLSIRKWIRSGCNSCFGHE